LPDRCGLHVPLEVSCYCPRSARCLRTGLTLRHSTPNRALPSAGGAGWRCAEITRLVRFAALAGALER
jgi:hypothetical protein